MILKDDTTYYAHWKKSIRSASISKTSVTLDKDEEYAMATRAEAIRMRDELNQAIK